VVALALPQGRAFGRRHPDPLGVVRRVRDQPAGEAGPLPGPHPERRLALADQPHPPTRHPLRRPPGRQGGRDRPRPAAGGRQLHPAQGQQVVEAQPGPGPGQLDLDRAGGRAPGLGQGGGVDPLDLVGHHRLALVVGQPGQGRLDRGRLLLAQGGVLGPLGLAQVDQARPVAPAPLLLPGQGDDQVAGGDDGIGGDRLVVQPLAGGKDPGQRLLDEVVDRVRVAHPGADHPPEQRLQLQDVLVPGVADRCPDPHGRSLAGMDVRPGGPCPYIHGCRRVMPAAVARSIY
jgi:hypothetical protein